MIEVCIIGFGFSAIPLVRELERTKTNFKIISGENDSVWDRLDKSGRLDFSLVSSYQSSFYSFDLVKDYEKDHFPTAKQFYEMHKRWRDVYQKKIIRDFVVRIDNFKDHSLIVTLSGEIFQAKHVIVATGFNRLMNKLLNDIDYSVSNKTFVFGTMGDSANLMISKLIPNNNKIILKVKGFTPLDQQHNNVGTIFTLDQGEFQNSRYISHEIYSAAMMNFMYTKVVNPSVLFNQFPLVNRDYSWVKTKANPPRGMIAIKYWPIDEYCQEFGNDLEESISKGYLLNDIAMWLHTGKVIIVPPDTPIDFENKTITYAGIERSFHQYIQGDAEQPRIPEIMIDGVNPYQYVCRDSFMGIIPQKLNNIYLLGFTRPITGGLANITEMQSLFIHKLVTQPEFHSKIHQNLSYRIAEYNNYYYGDTEPRKTDHTIFYGFYTEDIAKLIGIDHKVSECHSVKDLVFYYAFPNNAFKYRLKGEYAVNGIKELIEKVNHNYNHFIPLFSQLINCLRFTGIDDVSEWNNTSKHLLFNDMRYKESYKEFLEIYIQAYRRFKNILVDETVDKEWDVMVEEASKVRNTMIEKIEENSLYQSDDDRLKGIELISSIFNLDISSLPNSNDRNMSDLDSEFIDFIRSMCKPKEYNLSHPWLS
ncbi:MAG: thioredoxin reductase [Cyanobacteria bacterium P01_A01_bin.68]